MDAIPSDWVEINGDGIHFTAVVVSQTFEGLSLVQQHRKVYQALEGHIGRAIHSLTLKTFTPEAWKVSVR